MRSITRVSASRAVMRVAPCRAHTISLQFCIATLYRLPAKRYTQVYVNLMFHVVNAGSWNVEARNDVEVNDRIAAGDPVDSCKTNLCPFNRITIYPKLSEVSNWSLKTRNSSIRNEQPKIGKIRWKSSARRVGRVISDKFACSSVPGTSIVSSYYWSSILQPGDILIALGFPGTNRETLENRSYPAGWS